MEAGDSSKKKKGWVKDDFTDLIFSWSLKDIFDENLYKYQVEKIPISFQSVEHYLGSYVFPLLEETRTQLASGMEVMDRAPFAEVVSLVEAKPYGKSLYDIRVDYWRNRLIGHGRDLYRTLPGDVLIISDSKPETASDLQRTEWTWTFASVTSIEGSEIEDNSTLTKFKVWLPKNIEVMHGGKQKLLYVVFLLNITTNKRIWKALHMHNNTRIIQKVLRFDSLEEDGCDICSAHCDINFKGKIEYALMSKMNESQTNAIVTSLLRVRCDHKSHVQLIWGPPGTGKTRTVSMMLFALLEMNYRTLCCAPTNTAVSEVASRLVKQVKESFHAELANGDLLLPLGDILLFGNKDRLKVGLDILEVYLEYRVERLMECLGPQTGWKHCIASMLDFLEDCVSNYHIFVENELIKKGQQKNQLKVPDDKPKSFLEFARDGFKAVFPPLKRCVRILFTHVPRSFMLEQNFQNMLHLIDVLDSLEILLFHHSVASDELEEIFSHHEEARMEHSSQVVKYTSSLLYKRSQCISVLKIVRASLEDLSFPSLVNETSIKDFCFQKASLIFCTASGSFKLHSIDMEPVSLLVIDEAAQLKECESLISLQIQGLRHAVLVGDECQLPATVNSKVCDESGFGRSLFERLSSLGHQKHLLDVQYRMHPYISYFPSSNFYDKKILDGPNVLSKSYERRYLPGKMFGPYSFINVAGGREERDGNDCSLSNMVEVAVVIKIVHKLYEAWKGSNISLSIGVISPYAAQVAAIQGKLCQKYESLDGFSLKVKSIDGFQGGEEDVIIISTVRTNSRGSIGFLSSPQRTNVALTRARHCLWILGNERSLANSLSVWEALVYDARVRGCFFNADEDGDVSKIILHVKKELDQLDDLLNADSMLFREAKWKVMFSDFFRKSFDKLMSASMRILVLNLLVKLACGWRPMRSSVDSVCERSSQIVKKFNVGGLYVLCSIDIVKESWYKQVIKVWDILPLEEIPMLMKRLDNIFFMHTDDFINRCKETSIEGKLEVPKSWPTSSNIVRLKKLNNDDLISDSTDTLEGRSSFENSTVSESLLLVKFYSLSTGFVNHLLSDGDGGERDLPFEVTEEELEIIQFCKSCFVLGRSGTGKTTVLTMKLIQKEQIHNLAVNGFATASRSKPSSVANRTELDHSIGDTTGTVLRQLFITVNPVLCCAVKQHVSQLKRFACGGDWSAETSSIDAADIDEIGRFKDIQDSFVGIPAGMYPLVVTFRKFLMMLDGTLGDSYFERFHEIRKCSGHNNTMSKSVALQNFFRMKEVNYDRFSFFYWPHFNSHLTRNLDPSTVFTEIISHIKGGLQVGEAPGNKLSLQEYVSFSDRRVSTLSAQRREGIYNIFQDYEKMKMRRGEFDLADFVMDLHFRLTNKILEGDKMDFVYIDEVQDLTMREVSLLKYVCKNVDEGFVFSGDTAQTIARGTDFRFEDIRCLFYNEFVMKSDNESSSVRKKKGNVTEMFNLCQNFRTHSGVLKLAQSVIDLLYHFFPQSIDFLKPETSLVHGEPPLLLGPGNKESAIMTIFGKSVNVGGRIAEFGSEQVILVRNDSAKKEIYNYVGNQALVLTIVESKGLEFQDVLLYNFFSSSCLKDQWKVIYGFMKEKELLVSCLPKHFPSFNDAKHSILCSELKQLYVAITRTKQRLWILEEELPRPMFEYWIKLCLVQVKQVDDLLVKEMQMASSPAEWKSRGVKLYWERNYKMAAMCFARSGDTIWEKRANAAGLRVTADRLRGSNPEKACTILRQAAEIFDSIGRVESAAECFCDSGDYESAGRIYVDKCGESELKKAGECFTLARCFTLAAEIYAKGGYFLECLSVCKEAKLFDLGMQYIKSWKKLAEKDGVTTRRAKELDNLEQDFLETCAISYYEIKDSKSMMKHVRAFFSMDLRRNFLKSINCFDELLLLEEESGNFEAAAEIAKVRGYHLLEADMLAKLGHFREASLLILRYVLSNSLWVYGSRGWPLKPFAHNDKILRKAKSFAEQDSEQFHELVCTEIKVLSHEPIQLPDLYQYLCYSQHHKSPRVELLSMRKILDVHLSCGAVRYEWENEILDDLKKLSEESISQNQVSVGTLMYFWNLWKGNMLKISQYLEDTGKQLLSKYIGVDELCLNYFGVRRMFDNSSVTYVLMNPDAEWVKKVDYLSTRQSKNPASVDARQFSHAARSHCDVEIISVGFKVLDVLQTLYNLSMTKSFSLFCQSLCLIYIYQVTNFLTESFRFSGYDEKKLQYFWRLSSKYFENVFPLDYQKSLAENMISLRGTDLSHDLLEEIITMDISIKGELTYGQIGRVVMICLGFGQPRAELCRKISNRFDKNLAWKSFIEILHGSVWSESTKDSPSYNSVNRCRELESVEGTLELECSNKSESNVSDESSKNVLMTKKFHEALKDTYNATWRARDYVSPNCFLYLVERLLILVCHSLDFFYTSKYSFVEWLMYMPSGTYPSTTSVVGPQLSAEIAFDSVVTIVQELLHNADSTAEWISISNSQLSGDQSISDIPVDQYHSLLALRLVATMCCLCLNSGDYFDVLSDLLGQDHITSLLPRLFLGGLQCGRKPNHAASDENAIVEAFKRIGNPIVIVNLKGNIKKRLCHDAIFVDVGVTPQKEDIMGILFSKTSSY